MLSINWRWIPCALCLMLVSLPLAAERPWTASLHVGNVDIDRLVKDDGAWWSDVSDDNTALGLSLSYDFLPTLGLRLMYERADDFTALNACPPGEICLAVLITEQQDFEAWRLELTPRYHFSPQWSGFLTLGLKEWKLRRDNVLPGDSGTSFVYGLGIGWRAFEQLEFSFEYQRSDIDYEAFRLGIGVRF